MVVNGYGVKGMGLGGAGGVLSQAKVGKGSAGFDAVLEGATGAVDRSAPSDEATEKAASGLVSNALILPMLQQVRRSVWSEKGVFGGGNGEKMFGPQFDMQIADRLSQSPQMAVTQVLKERLAKRHKLAMPQNLSTSETANGTANGTKNKALDVHG